MKKRMIALFLLITCLMLTGCSNATTIPETEEPQATASEEELYMYSVGGTVLYLHTRVEDYLTDDCVPRYDPEKKQIVYDGLFRYDDLMSDLGWYIREGSREGSMRREYNTEDAILYVYIAGIKEYGEPVPNVGIFESIEFGQSTPEIDHWNYRFSCHMYVDTDSLEDETLYHPNGDEDRALFLNQIIVLTYLLENYPNDQGEDFFSGIFEKIGPHHWYVYEN